MPRNASSPRLRFALLAALALATVGGVASAQPTVALPSPLTVEAVVRLARAHRAEITAARQRAGAAAQRPTIVASLPDPMVMLAADHLPFALHGVDASFQVQQDFPLSGVLGARRRASEADARRATLDVRRVALDVELEAVRAFYMLDERRRTAAVLDAQLALTHDLVAAATARYGAAQGPQGDALQARMELARLQAQRVALDAEVRAAEAMLHASVGGRAEASVPALAAAVRDDAPPPSAGLVRAALDRRPELAAMHAEVARSQAEVGAMEAMYWPMAFVRAGPAYTMADGPGVMLMVGVTVPLWRARLRAGVAEARAMVAMSRADLDAMRTMVAGEVGAARETVLARRALRAALRDEVVPLARQAVDALLASYAAGQSPLIAVLDAARRLLDAQMDAIMTEVNLGLAWARLERATGQLGDVP